MRVESLQSRAISVLIVLLLTIAPCLGQSSASLEVIVKDPSGALINKAQVQLIRNGKPQAATQTNQRGEARFNKVSPGRYQLHVEAAGFKAQDIDESKAEEARKRAEERLRGEKMSDEEVASVTAALAHSLAQLKVKRRQR